MSEETGVLYILHELRAGLRPASVDMYGGHVCCGHRHRPIREIRYIVIFMAFQANKITAKREKNTRMFCQFQKKPYLCTAIQEEMLLRLPQGSRFIEKDNTCWRGGGIGRRATLRW